MTQHNLGEHLEWLERTRPQVPQATTKPVILQKKDNIVNQVRGLSPVKTAGIPQVAGAAAVAAGKSTKPHILPSNGTLSNQLSQSSFSAAPRGQESVEPMPQIRLEPSKPSTLLSISAKRTTERSPEPSLFKTSQSRQNNDHSLKGSRSGPSFNNPTSRGISIFIPEKVIV